MATRFVRVDLSDTSRDYRPIAVEPGVPMLDRSGSNSKIIFRWLGGMVADPVWEDESVNFFVREDKGGRLEEVTCQPATEQDLKSLLKDDLAKLKSRLEGAKAETPSERTLRKILIRSFHEVVDSPGRNDHDNYFFRYRDVTGAWRLVWCWGFQRLDQEPAPAVVCTDPECKLLFVRRPGKSPRCPSCEAMLSLRPVRRTNLRLAGLAAALLLLLLLGLGYLAIRPSQLVAEPGTYDGLVGSRTELKVYEKSLFRKKEVTSEALGYVLDPRVARFKQHTGTASLIGPGTTKIHFQKGSLTAEATVNAELASNPDRIVIEPRNLDLGIGTTARLKVFGEFSDGRRLDLTDAAEWKPLNDGVVYSNGGLVEGLAEGAAMISARYRASAKSEYREAAANISVAKIDFKSLDVAIEPTPVGIGRASRLRIDAVAEDGTRYSVLESSLLRTSVDPPHLATVYGRSLRGDRSGQGKLSGTFAGSVTGEKELTVGTLTGLEGLVVHPKVLDLVVGEITGLTVVSPSSEPVRLRSSKPDSVEVTADNRLIGRAVGQAKVEVSQGDQTREIEVSVSQAEFEAIFIDPTRVVVAVDDSLRPRVVAHVKGESPRFAEIAPDLVTCEKAPSPRFAELTPRTLELRGVALTDPSSPQALAVRFSSLRDTAPVEVIEAPLQLEITPAGPIELPLGLMMRLQGWAQYSGGRRVQVPSERLAWKTEEADKSVDGLRLFRDRVGALKAGAGPLTVYATYFKKQSNRVVFKSVDADPTVKLAIDVDRTLRLAGEPGRAALTATNQTGDVELVPELAAYKTSDEKIVKIHEKSGAFRAETPGEAAVTASHLAAKEPTSLGLKVYDPAKARLVFEPNSVVLNVNEQAELKLMIEVKDGDKVDSAVLEGPGVAYMVGNPEAVRWSPPRLTGLVPAKLFELLAGYRPVLSTTASAKIEVAAASQPEAIRIVPSNVTLAPGQGVALAVEQQVPGSPDEWKEVRPDAVSWKVPASAAWTPATAGLRPVLTVPPGATRELQAQATVGGQQAIAIVGVKPSGPDAADPAARLVVVREPGSRYLAAGRQQRYSIVVEKDGSSEPATDVRWPENFENQYVQWEAPVLTAKRGGHVQWMRAEAGGRIVLFHTTTYDPMVMTPDQPPGPEGTPAVVEAPRGDIPDSVKILSDQGQSVRFPVGATFRDFRVEAHYPDGFTRLVTKKATLRTPEPPASAYLTASNGALIGVRPGVTAVSAEFETVKSTVPLGAEVLGSVDVDRIAIEPAPVQMLRGETVPLRAIGYKDGKSIGEITGLPNLSWQSDKPEVAKVSGPQVVGAELGQANVTARFGNMPSQPLQVSVVASIADNLKVDPKAIQIPVGGAARIGSDLQVFRGDMEVSSQCAVTSTVPGILKYDADTRSVIGLRPGTGSIAITLGDKMVDVPVVVGAGGLVNYKEGEVIIEPGTVTMAPGQAEPLRVYVVAAGGERIDRTASSSIASSDPKVVAVTANGKANALSPGTVQLTATVAGADKTGQAVITVKDEKITGLELRPTQLDMQVGDTKDVQILGQAPCGTREMFPQEALKVTAIEPRPGIIKIVGADQVNAVGVGQASVDVAYGSLRAQTQVTVANNPITDLQIRPAETTVGPGQGITYEVVGKRGGEIRVLGPEDGVQLFVDNQQVASVVDGFSVRAKAPGRAIVVAQRGNQKAEAGLNVGVERVAVDERRTVDGGGHVIDVDDAIFGHDDHVVVEHHGHGDGHGDVVVEDHGPGYTETVPTARVVGLRFVPEALHLATGGEPSMARVVEVLDDGRDGNDVTADPKLQVTDPADVAKLEKTKDGPAFRPVSPGQTQATATLGELKTSTPLLIDVGGQVMLSNLKLIVSPDPMTVWSGEAKGFDTVQIDPGGGLAPFPVEYKVTAPDGQGIVKIDPDNKVRGSSIGSAQVTITPTDAKYAGVAAVAAVQVTGGEQLSIEPAQISLQVGDRIGGTARPVAVMSRSADGTTVGVPANLESMDLNILAPSPENPGEFVAKAMGQTKLRATYRGGESLATVSVTGQRFADVKAALNTAGKNDFDVTIEVLAASDAGELEYRVYVEGQTPEENWVPNQAEGTQRKATLRSPRIPRKDWGELYHLVVEARDKSTKSAQQYPLTLGLETIVKQVKPDQ